MPGMREKDLDRWVTKYRKAWESNDIVTLWAWPGFKVSLEKAFSCFGGSLAAEGKAR